MIEFDSPDKFIGTTAALIIGGLSAASAIGSAKIASNAAHSAADQQQQAGEQARAYQQQATQQAMARLDAGQAGIRYAPTYTAPGAQSSGAYGALAGAMGLGSRPGTPAMQAPYQPPNQMMPSVGPGGSPSGGEMVQMRAPTGEVSSVPANQVQHYLAKGAVQI